MRDKMLNEVELLLPDASWKPLGRSLPHRFFLKRQNLLQKLPGTSPLPSRPRGTPLHRPSTGRPEVPAPASGAGPRSLHTSLPAGSASRALFSPLLAFQVFPLPPSPFHFPPV